MIRGHKVTGSFVGAYGIDVKKIAFLLKMF